MKNKNKVIFVKTGERHGDNGYYTTLDKWAEKEHQKQLDRLAQVDDEPKPKKEEDCDSYRDNLEDR